MKTFTYGDRFLVTGVDGDAELCMIAQVGKAQGMLVSVQDGNRWADVTVDLVHGCTSSDVSEMTLGADWEHVGTLRQPGWTDNDYDQDAWRVLR